MKFWILKIDLANLKKNLNNNFLVVLGPNLFVRAFIFKRRNKICIGIPYID